MPVLTHSLMHVSISVQHSNSQLTGCVAPVLNRLGDISAYQKRGCCWVGASTLLLAQGWEGGGDGQLQVKVVGGEGGSEVVGGEGGSEVAGGEGGSG